MENPLKCNKKKLQGLICNKQKLQGLKKSEDKGCLTDLLVVAVQYQLYVYKGNALIAIIQPFHIKIEVISLFSLQPN